MVDLEGKDHWTGADHVKLAVPKLCQVFEQELRPWGKYAVCTASTLRMLLTNCDEVVQPHPVTMPHLVLCEPRDQRQLEMTSRSL